MDAKGGLSGEQKEALDNWLLLAALRESMTQTHDLCHITYKSHDIDFAHCSLWVCKRNRQKLLDWGCDVAAIPEQGAPDGR